MARHSQNPSQQEKGCYSGTHSLCLQLLTLPRSCLECAIGRREKVWRSRSRLLGPGNYALNYTALGPPLLPAHPCSPTHPHTCTHIRRHLDQTNDLPASICFLQSPNGTLAPADGCVWALSKCWLLIDCAVDSCQAHSLNKLRLVRGGTSLRAVRLWLLSFFPIESEEPNTITVDCREKISLSKCEEAEEGLRTGTILLFVQSKGRRQPENPSRMNS